MSFWNLHLHLWEALRIDARGLLRFWYKWEQTLFLCCNSLTTVRKALLGRGVGLVGDHPKHFAAQLTSRERPPLSS